MPQPSSTTGKTILVADDEASMRKVLSLRLGSCGYKIILVADGCEAVQLAKERRPDLVLLDVMMPRLDGFETCRTLKAAQETRDIPVLLITAKDSESLSADVRASGADGYVRKPYDYQELLDSIRDVLEKSHPKST